MHRRVLQQVRQTSMSSAPRSMSAAMAMGWVIEPARPERRRCAILEADIEGSRLSNSKFEDGDEKNLIVKSVL